jgi:hypothetical protein
VLAVEENRFAVDEDVGHARRELMRFVVAGVVLDRSGIEDDDVGEITSYEQSAYSCDSISRIFR